MVIPTSILATMSESRGDKPALAVLAAVLAALAAATVLSGCDVSAEATESRPLMGTAITITAYGEDEDTLRGAVDAAFSDIESAAAGLDAWDEDSPVAAFNAAPYEAAPLPEEFGRIRGEVARLGVGAWFSPTLMGVTALYDMDGGGSVPSDAELAAATAAAASLLRTEDGWRFTVGAPDGAPLPVSPSTWPSHGSRETPRCRAPSCPPAARSRPSAPRPTARLGGSASRIPATRAGSWPLWREKAL